MSGAIKVEVEGMPEVFRKIRETLAIVRADIEAVLQQTIEDGQRRAQDVVPVRTGALRAAIVFSGTKLTRRLYIKGRGPQRYAPFVEYGSRHVSAYGYMRAARSLIRAQLPQGTRIVARKLPGAVARS